MLPLLLLAIPASLAITTQPLGHVPAQESFRLDHLCKLSLRIPSFWSTSYGRLNIPERKKPAWPGSWPEVACPYLVTLQDGQEVTLRPRETFLCWGGSLHSSVLHCCCWEGLFLHRHPASLSSLVSAGAAFTSAHACRVLMALRKSSIHPPS